MFETGLDKKLFYAKYLITVDRFYGIFRDRYVIAVTRTSSCRNLFRRIVPNVYCGDETFD